MSRSSRHVARDRITSSRLSRQLTSGAARHLFFAGYQKQPRHRRCRRSPFSKQRGSCSGDRSNTPSPPPSSPSSTVPFSLVVSLPSSFSLFFPPPPPLALATLLTLSRSCVSYVRTNSISRDSLRSRSAVNYFSNSRSRPALLRTPVPPPPSFFPVPSFPYSSYPWLGLFLLRLFRPTP